MTASLAAAIARLLALLLPLPLPPVASLRGLLAVVVVLAVADSGWMPFGCLGMPGEPPIKRDGP